MADLRSCFCCKSEQEPLRARTFYMRGKHETFYTCRRCHWKMRQKAVAKGVAPDSDVATELWASLPLVPGTENRG